MPCTEGVSNGPQVHCVYKLVIHCLQVLNISVNIGGWNVETSIFLLFLHSSFFICTISTSQSPWLYSEPHLSAVLPRPVERLYSSASRSRGAGQAHTGLHNTPHTMVYCLYVQYSILLCDVGMHFDTVGLHSGV